MPRGGWGAKGADRVGRDKGRWSGSGGSGLAQGFGFLKF